MPSKANMDRPMTPDELDPERDLKPLADEVDKLLGIPGVGKDKTMSERNGESQPLDKELKDDGSVEPMPEGSTSGSPDAGMQELADVVGGMDKANKMIKAAMSLPETKGKTPSELAVMIKKDYSLRSKLMGQMASDEDMEAADGYNIVPEGSSPMPMSPPPSMPPMK